jgi:putative inorganic carbon (HCO3(-)) transporter
MSRFAGGVPLVWIVVMLVGAGLTAAASVLLAHRVSPVVVASLPLVAVGFWVILRYRIGALVLLLLCLPLGRLTLAELGPVPVSPVTVLAVVVVAVWLWRVVIGSERIELSHMQLPLTIFLLWGTVGIYGAADVGMAVKILFIFVMGASVYLVASQTIRSPQEARGVMWAAAVAAGIVGLSTAVAGVGGTVADVQAYEGGGSYDRVEGIFGSPNLLGGFLALAIPPTVALAASENLWWRRLLGYLLVIAALAGLAFTYSRGAWLGTGVGLLMLLPVLKRGFWLILGSVLIGIFSSASAVLARLQSIVAAGSDPAFTSRLEIWGTALRLVAEHPLLGVGLGNFREAYGNLLVPDLPLLAYTLGVPEGAHNLFLNLAVEVGLVGAGAFAWLLAVAFLRAWQLKRFADQQVRVWGTGLAAGLVAILVHTFVDVVIYQGFVAILLFVYLGIMDALRRFAGSQVGYEYTPPTIPSSTRGQRSTPSAAHMEFDRPQIEPVRHLEN